MNSKNIDYSRKNRKQATKSEGLLWSRLRARQLCGLKFRREHTIGSWIADFACEETRLVVEIDGGYHDHTAEQDLEREQALRTLGWDVLRFSDEEVEQDTDAVCHAIASHLELEYSFQKRDGGQSGMKARRHTTKVDSQQSCTPSPKSRPLTSTLPKEGKNDEE